MNIFMALILVVAAGILIGTYGTPPKYMKQWPEEIIWAVSSLFSFFILPIVSIFLLSGSSESFFKALSSIPGKYITALLVFGACWGIGQILFSIAFRFIGIGLNFVINISIGTAGTALLPLLWNRALWASAYAYLQILGIIIFILAVVSCTIAGSLRDRNKLQAEGKAPSLDIKLIIGVLFAVIAGIGSICQGISYVYANPTVSSAALAENMSALSANSVAWVFVFVGAGIPFIIYFLLAAIRRKTLHSIICRQSLWYLVLSFFMGFCYWIPMIMFSKASMLIGGSLAPTITWPLFMVFIILTSNAWSIISGEWKGAGNKAVRSLKAGIGFFILAIIVFTLSSLMK